MRAADLTTADVGADIVIVLGSMNVAGKLVGITWPIGMVSLDIADGADTDGHTTIVVDSDKAVTLPYEHLRFRAVTEPDIERRAKYLHEINHQHVLGAVRDVLGEDESWRL